MRLRMSVFRSLLRQEVAYFDDNRHSATKLTTRMATDAPNVKSVSTIFLYFLQVFYGYPQ